MRVPGVLWIATSALLLLVLIFAGWRLRRANRTLNRILTEELDEEGAVRVSQAPHPIAKRGCGGWL